MSATAAMASAMLSPCSIIWISSSTFTSGLFIIVGDTTFLIVFLTVDQI
jgi:hypothetical protein